MKSRESTGEAFLGCAISFATLIGVFPMWVYVIRSILVRGDATDFEWFVFYAYVVGHAVMCMAQMAFRLLVAEIPKN